MYIESTKAHGLHYMQRAVKNARSPAVAVCISGHVGYMCPQVLTRFAAGWIIAFVV